MWLKKIVLVSSFLLLWANSSLLAQVDTLFWFAVPNVCNNHASGDDVQELRLASFNTTDVTVTIDIPANPSFAPRVRTIPAGGLITEVFNKSDVEIPSNNTPSNTGLRVRATQMITAYYEIGRGTDNTDIFSLKGTNALGRKFYTVFQTDYDIDSRFYPEAQSSVNIVALENNTVVTIVLPSGKQAAGWGATETTRTITLQRGQTYSFASNSASGANRLTGTLITSTRQIAVTTSDDSVFMSGSADLAGDQLVPFEVVGTEYLIPPGLLESNIGDNTAYIVATEDNTAIEVNNSFIVNLSAGQSYGYKMPDRPSTEARFLSATKPVYVLYLSGFGTEVGSPLLPTIKCTGSNRVGFVRSTDKPFYLTILAQDEAIGNFTIEGGGASQAMLNDANNYVSNASFPGWKVLQKEFSSIPVNTAITIQNSRAYFHLGIINGTDFSSASFGYFSDYGKIQTALPPRLSACPNTTLVLDPKLFGTFNSKIWKRNGNVFSGGTIDGNTGKLTFLVPFPTNPGVPDQYTLELKDNRACQFEDTVRLTVFAQPDIALNTEGNRNVCSNDPNAFIIANQILGNITNYRWKYFANAAAPATNPGNPFPSSSATQHLPKVGGIYRVIGTDNNTCKDSAQVNITFNTAKLVNITDQIPVVCNNIGFTLNIINNPTYNGFKDFVWRKDNVVINGATNSSFAPTSNGNYTLTVKDEFDCTSSDGNNISFVSPVTFDLGDKPTICSAENFNINVVLQPANSSINSLVWFKDNVQFLSGVGNKTYKPTAAGVYRVNIVDNNNCPFNDAININKFSTTVPVVLNTPASPFCSNATDVLSHATPAVTPNFKTYQWQRDGADIANANQSTYRPTQPGTYRLKVTDNNDCPSEDAKTINWQVAQTFDLGSDQDVICTNGNFNITVNGNFSSLVWKFNTAIFTPTSGNGGKTHKPILGQNGTYEVSGKDANGCNASDAVAIGKVVDSTKLSLTQPPNNVCSNAGFKIDVSPNNLPTYNWFFNSGSAPAPNTGASYTPRATGTYRVVAIDANTCVTSEKVTVNFVDTLALNLNTPPNVFCANNTTYRITPSGGSFSSYIFKRNNQIINPISGPGVSHKPTQSGIYLVEGTDSRGCVSRRNVTINYQDTANFQLPQLPTVICDNANGNNTTTIIDATGPFTTYQWFLNNVQFTPNVSNSRHRPTARGNYKVIVTDANTCTASDVVTANYFLPLVMKLTPSPAGNIACWNTNYTLTPTAGFTTYQWSVSATSPALTIPTNTFAYKPTQSGKYKVIGTDPNTCKSADSITITYVQDFKLDLGGVKAACTDVSFTIDATKPNIVRYDWSNNASATNPPISKSTFDVTGPGKYAVKLTDLNGCIDQDTLDFQRVDKLPLELGNDRIACSYQGFAVDATPNYKTYEWTNTAGVANPDISTSKFTITATGKYSVKVTDVTGLCTATDEVSITYVPDLGFQLNNNFADTICFNDLYPSRYILAKDSIKFTNIPYTWSWDVPNGEPKPLNVVKHQPGTSGRYIVTVTDKSNNCFDSDTVNVDFSRLLANFDLGKPNDTVCYNVRDSITSTLIEYRNTTQYTWAWKVENGAVNPGTKTVAYPDRTGKYLATLTDRYKCKASDSVFVQFSDSLIDFDLGNPDLKICIATVGDQKIIEATNRKYDNTTNYNWLWTVPTDQVKPGNVSKVTPIKSGNYSVLITDKWGCKNTDSKNIDYFNDLFGFKIKTPKDTICFNDLLVNLTAKATDRKFDNLAIYKWTWTVPTNSKITRLDSNAVVTDTSGRYIALIENKENKCINADTIKILFSDSLKALVFTDPFDTICFNSDIARKTIEAKDKKYNDLKYYTWSWALPDNSNPGNVSVIKPDSSGVYTAKVKDIYGCEASANAIIKYSNDLFGFDLGPAKDTICFNAKVTLTDTAYAKAQYTWQWTVKPRTNITVLNENKIEPDSSGLYIAVVKNTFECFNSDSVDVIFSDSLLAFALAKPSDTICYNADSLKKVVTTKVLKYKNLNEYTWDWSIVPAGFVNPGNQNYVIPTKSGQYEALVQDRWKCKARSSTVVNFSNDLFGFDLGKPADTVCFNLPKTITSTLDTFKTNFYTWDWIEVPASAVAPNGAKAYQPKVSGKYTVKITNREKCDNKDSVDITFSDALAGFSLGNKEDTVCSNRPADSLQATSSIYNDLNKFNWKWTVPDNQINVGNYYKIFPRFSGNYTAIITDQWKCEVKKTKAVTYGPPVVIGLDNADTTACSYANYVINAGSGYVKYVWNVPNHTESTYRPSTSGKNKYIVTVTDALGCVGSDSVNVNYVPDINAQLPNIKDICDSDSLLEGGIITAASGFDTYKWMNNPVGGKNDSTYRPSFPIFVGNSIEKRITVVVSLDICTAEAFTDVTFVKKDNKYLGPDTTVCLDKPVLLDAGPNFYSYVWKSTGTGDSVLSEKQAIIVTRPDFYYVDLVSQCGSLRPSRDITNFDTIQYDFTPNSELCVGEKMDIQNLTENKKQYHYTWYEKNSLTYIPDTTYKINIERGGNYQVIVRDINKCIMLDSIQVTMTEDCFTIPNLFTPNGDEENQTFKILGIYKGEWELEVYNRWGDRVYYNTKYDNLWAGENVSTGVYYYELRNAKKDKKYKGWVQIAK